MRKTLLFIISVLFVGQIFAQLTTSPTFIQKGYTGEITVYFDPSAGNKGMEGATACYAHTGLITNLSTNDGDWKHTICSWRDGSAKSQMTKEGNLWKLVIPNIYTFYNCLQTEEIQKIAFVFNDGPNGSKEGKAASGQDIFIELVEAGLKVKFMNIAANALIESSVPTNFEISCTEEANITLFVDNEQVTTTENTTNFTYTHTFATEGDHTIKAIAATETETDSATLNLSVMRATELAPRPADKQDMGIYYDENDATTVTLVTYAASKTDHAKAVFVVGDFNNWEINTDYQMKRDGNYFWLTINNLAPRREYRYQYYVIRADGTMKKISDLYSTKVLHKDDQYEPRQIDPYLLGYPAKGDGYVSVLQTGKFPYTWSDATLNFQRPDKNNLVIYELWVYDFTPERSIEGLRQRLDYIQNLGVNAIELMPICEFDGNYNWGYSPNHYFALDKAYGTPEQFKRFVDECHRRGMAVIVDMVFNHGTGNNPMNKLYPYGADLANNPWFNVSAPHSDNVYEDWNHDFEETRKMFTKALQYWLTEYKIDGYRMDLSHGFCGINCSNLMSNLRHYYTNGVQAGSAGAYFILEHWGGNMGTERPALIADGMLCWNNTGHAYCQTAGGSISSGFGDANKDGYVSYCESHDEERNFYAAKTSGVECIKNDESLRLNRVPVNMAFNILLNGPKMIWQYNELGYDYSINSTVGSTSISSGNRCNKKEQPEKLGWFSNTLRMAQYQKVAQMIHLRTHLAPQVFEGDPVSVNIGSNIKIRTIVWGEGQDRIIVVGNFSPDQVQTYRLPDGAWFDYFEAAPLRSAILNLMPGELKIITARHYELPVIPVSYDFTTDTEQPLLNQDGKILVYPTLTTGNVYLSQEAQIEVYNLQGQLMQKEVNSLSINLSALNNGIYFLRLDGQQTVKVVKH